MRILIINWRWQNVQTPKEFKNNDSGDILYCCGYTTAEANQLQQYIESKIQINSEYRVLVLTHYNEGNNSEAIINEKRYINPNIIDSLINSIPNLKYKIRSFFGGSNSPHSRIIYKDDKGLLDDTALNYERLKIDDNTFNENRYEFVWDWYWKKLELENLKKDIINLWLPLGIDMQGLNELFQGSDSNKETKIEDYLKEVDVNIKQYADNYINKWQEIEKILLPAEDRLEVLDEKYRLTHDEKKKVKFPIENIDVNSLEEFIRENFRDSNNPNFLPKWLQEVVRILDKKIKQNK